MKDLSRIVRERLERWRSFVEGGQGAFLYHLAFPLSEAESKRLPAPVPRSDKVGQRVEERWHEYQVMCRKAELVDDDHVPHLNNLTGTEIFAEAFGCKVHRPADSMPFALPLVYSAAEADALKTPELSRSSLAWLFDVADELYRRSGPDAVMRLVDVQSPMDIVALIWNKEELFCAMLETPEAVKALAGKVRALLTAFFDEWFRRYGTTFVAHFPDYVMHGGLTLSVDEVGAVNADMFREFFRDELAALSAHFGGLGIHCCADARHQWGNFRDLPGLNVLNHVAPPTRNAREYLLDSIRCYGNGIVQWPIGWTPDGPPDTWPAQFPAGARVVFEVPAKDAAEAASIAGRLQELRGRIAAPGA